MKRASPLLRNRARALRKCPTLSERRLWNWLRNRTVCSYKFRRQFAVEQYVLDFYCPELRLGIEVDGSQHGELRVIASDAVRTRQLAVLGIRIERIPNALLAKDAILVEQQIRFWIETRERELLGRE